MRNLVLKMKSSIYPKCLYVWYQINPPSFCVSPCKKKLYYHAMKEEYPLQANEKKFFRISAFEMDLQRLPVILWCQQPVHMLLTDLPDRQTCHMLLTDLPDSSVITRRYQVLECLLADAKSQYRAWIEGFSNKLGL